MKQLKLLMLSALMLLMGVSFTSCLDSNDSENTFDYVGLVLVRGSMGITAFEDAVGNMFYVSQSSVTQWEANSSSKLSDYQFGQAYLKFIETGNGEKATASETEPSTYQVDLVAFSPCEYAAATMATNSENMDEVAPETSPVISMAPDNLSPWQYSSNLIVMPLQWRLENSAEAFKKHHLVLVYVADEIEADDTELTLYLRHNNGGDEKTEVYYANYYAYDITMPLSLFYSKTGKNPTRLIIKGHESGTYSDTMPTTYSEYTIDYKVSK